VEKPKRKTVAFLYHPRPDHCRAVENLIFKLIPHFEKLKEEERFCLLASAWLHDIGMLPSVADQFKPPKKKY
jgi:HD superfamily phosphohydrolase YqeK